MTTFQDLSRLLTLKATSKYELRVLIENSCSKLEQRLLTPTRLIEIIKLSKEAISDARHITERGNQEYFDELVSRDLAS